MSSKPTVHGPLAALVVSLCVACEGGQDAQPNGSAAVSLPYQPPAFCERAGEDGVRDLFCGTSPPAIASLQQLYGALALGPAAPGDDDASYRENFHVLLGHSTALSGQLVSSINPRVVLGGATSFIAYQRGVQQVEIATRARDTGELNFYLVSFEQACNASSTGCGPGDLFTPSVESHWLHVSARDAEQLKNTPLDCRQCHQRAREQPMLLMRELVAPWTHFFAAFDGGRAKLAPGVDGIDLADDYVAAKGDEVYAGLSLASLQHTVGFLLEQVVPKEQPLLYDSRAIVAERWPYGPNGYASEPLDSPSWEASYEAFKRGEQLAPPYLETRVSDPDKLAQLSEAYRQYRAGSRSAEQLPNLADIFPDDPRTRARIGLTTELDATPAQLLIQACGSCHNDVLDQTITRAHFNIDIARMERAELLLAIERMERGRHQEGAMPPPGFRQLDDEGRRRLIELLREPLLSDDDAALLKRAAQLGMAGGAPDSAPEPAYPYP